MRVSSGTRAARFAIGVRLGQNLAFSSREAGFYRAVRGMIGVPDVLREIFGEERNVGLCVDAALVRMCCSALIRGR